MLLYSYSEIHQEHYVVQNVNAGQAGYIYCYTIDDIEKRAKIGVKFMKSVKEQGRTSTHS